MNHIAFASPTVLHPHHPLHSPTSRRLRPTRRLSPCCAQTPPSSPARLLTQLAQLNARLQTIKCPFWRRRFTDTLEAAGDILHWALRTRHKSLSLPLSLPSSTFQTLSTTPKLKRTALSLEDRIHIIRDDFIRRQYYVTGRLSMDLYRDDCLFDGPDPDGRVQGLRKFVNAASGLFDARKSNVDLVDIYAQEDGSIVAEWRLEGALMLPWRPVIKPYVGQTTYTFDDDALICSHVETWQVSVVDAFISVVVKGFGVPPAPSGAELRARKLREGSLRWREGVDVYHEDERRL